MRRTRSFALPYFFLKPRHFALFLCVALIISFPYQILNDSKLNPSPKYTIHAKKSLRRSSSSYPSDFAIVVDPQEIFELAKKESFGFFYDVPEDDWKRRQLITAEVKDHFDLNNTLPSSDDDGWEKYFAWYYENYEPNFSCSFERRVGGNGNGDGPKWVCDPHRITHIAKERIKSNKNNSEYIPSCVIYSIGSNGDFQFELGMQEIVGVGVCEIHIFDMDDYEKDIPKELKNAHFHQWGIVAQEDSFTNKTDEVSGHKFYGLEDTIKMLNHTKLESIDIFKIDCENCEWTSFQSWFSPNLPRLSQILVEIHKPPRSMSTVFFDTLQANGYVRFHKEVNCKFYLGGAAEFAFLKVSPDFFPPEKLKSSNLKAFDKKELKFIKGSLQQPGQEERKPEEAGVVAAVEEPQKPEGAGEIIAVEQVEQNPEGAGVVVAAVEEPQKTEVTGEVVAVEQKPEEAGIVAAAVEEPQKPEVTGEVVAVEQVEQKPEEAGTVAAVEEPQKTEEANIVAVEQKPEEAGIVATAEEEERKAEESKA